MHVTYVGLDDVDMDMESIESIVERHIERITKLNEQVDDLVVHVKKHKGTQHKFTVKVRAHAPRQTYVSDHAWAWDLRKAIHMSLSNIEHQVAKSAAL